MFFPGAAVYMDKLVGGEEVAHAISIDAEPGENVRAAAEAKGVKPSEIAVVVLDRERNQPIIDGAREAGAKVNLITDGDVAPAIAAARQGTGVDLMMGIGGTPEGVIAAAAVKCLGGVVQGRLWPRTDEERQALVDAGYDPDRVCSRPTISSRVTTCSSRPRASPTARSCAGSASRAAARRRSRSSCARDRHGQAHRGPTRARQARALLRPPVPLAPGSP